MPAFFPTVKWHIILQWPYKKSEIKHDNEIIKYIIQISLIPHRDITLSNRHPQKTSNFQLKEHRFLQVCDLADDLSLSQEEGYKEECKGNFPIFSFWNTSSSGIQEMKK